MKRYIALSELKEWVTDLGFNDVSDRITIMTAILQ